MPELWEDLEKLPLPLQEEFHKAAKTLSLIFKEDEMASWAISLPE